MNSCVNCGNASAKNKFCSLSCAAIYGNRIRRAAGEFEPKHTCTQCHQPTRNPQFCSRSCAATYNNAKSPKRTSTLITICTCGARKSPYAERCRTCKSSELYKSQVDRWLEGNLEVTWSLPTKEPKKFVKRYLIETRGDKCEVCGWSEPASDGRSIIQMDHIDGDYTNNLLSNLKLLCPNHHAMTDTYGSKNTFGRPYRAGTGVKNRRRI